MLQSLRAFVGIVAFTLLHVIGARYIYSYVPYKEWAVSLGLVEKGFFHDPRNHYDRLVHFSFGALLFPYFVERVIDKERPDGIHLSYPTQHHSLVLSDHQKTGEFHQDVPSSSTLLR